MKRWKLWLPLAALAGGLIAGVAAAGVPLPHTSSVIATLGANRIQIVHEQTCTGDDGQYRAAAELYAGSIGGDPRLNGVATLFLHSLTNTTTGNGTLQGAMLVVDPQSQQVRFRAALMGVSSGGVMTGLATGYVRDLSNNPGGLLTANFQAISNGTSLYVSFGGPGTNAHPAMIQRGYCQPSAK